MRPAKKRYSRLKRTMWKLVAAALIAAQVSGCSTIVKPSYHGVNPENSQFERGRPFLPLDAFGDLLSKLPQLFLWNERYGNHQISQKTEADLSAFLEQYGDELKDLKIRINQWAPHKELGRLIKNPHIAWPYKILYFPSTFLTSLIARPLSGLFISDYFDPASNTVHIFSNDSAIALHEVGHALDFIRMDYKGTYALARLLPGVNLFQEGMATSEALYYLEKNKKYEELLQAYKVLYPAYATYLIGYFSAAPPAYIGAILIGHWLGRATARDKEWQLQSEGKMPVPAKGA